MALTSFMRPLPCGGRIDVPGGQRHAPQLVRDKSSPSYRDPARCKRLFRSDRLAIEIGGHLQRRLSAQGARQRPRGRAWLGDSRQHPGGTRNEEVAFLAPHLEPTAFACSLLLASLQIDSNSPI